MVFSENREKEKKIALKLVKKIEKIPIENWNRIGEKYPNSYSTKIGDEIKIEIYPNKGDSRGSSKEDLIKIYKGEEEFYLGVMNFKNLFEKIEREQEEKRLQDLEKIVDDLFE